MHRMFLLKGFKVVAVLSILLMFNNSSWGQIQKVNIGEKTLNFYDGSRNRPVTTEIWYPTNDSLKASDKKYSPFIRGYTVRDATPRAGIYPLIMISHGSGGGRLTLEWIAQDLVKNGYIVAAVDHWGNTFDNPVAAEFVKPWVRPPDISFALTEILKSNEFSKFIDPEAIGALGYSFGGYTVIALAGAVVDYDRLIEYFTTVGKKEAATPQFPELWKLLTEESFLEETKKIPPLKDRRIKAFFSICPGTGPGFYSKEQFKNVQGKDVFIVGTAGDSIAPVEGYARNYHRLISGSGYYEFPGKVGHYVMLNEAKEELKNEEPQAFIDDATVDRGEVHSKVMELAVGFFNKRLK